MRDRERSPRGIRLIGLMPEARIFTCISVSIVPGEKPKQRTPRSPASRATARVSMASPALPEQ